MLSVVCLVVSVLGHTAMGDYSDPGYGTKYGTEPGQAVQGRTVGLGASPGPVMGEEDILLEVLHRLELYKKLASQDSNPGYTDSHCGDTCPPGSHCSYGLCFCDSDTELSPDTEVLDLEASSDTADAARNLSGLVGPLQVLTVVPGAPLGKCGKESAGTNETGETGESVGLQCETSEDCWDTDINSACFGVSESNSSTCQCRPGTVYSHRRGECEMDMSVDCSSISPDSPPSPALKQFVDKVLASNSTLAPSLSWPGIYDSILAYMDPDTSHDDAFLLEAFCRDVDIFAEQLAEESILLTVEEAIEEVVTTCATILGMVVAILLLLLVLLCLAGCICYCCLDSCRVKIKNLFAPTNYTEGLDNKAAAGLGKDFEAGEKDDLERVITGYQPVPQHPPPSYPQGANSLPRSAAINKGTTLPRGASLPRNTSSLKRGVSPIPRAYPALTEAPPGYPESPQKTGVPPLGFPQSPPEYPQTPTPPGFPANQNKQPAALYPTVPEK